MTQTINPEKNYHVVEANKITLEKRDLGIWSGHGMSKEFKAGFNGFFKEDETFIYYATEIEPETAPETEAKEINQPEPEKATESHTEPQSTKSSHQVISRDQINAWNRMVNEIAGTKLWHRFVLQKEYKDCSRWIYQTHNASIRACYKEQDGERFYIKLTKILYSGKSNVWLYWENCAGTESERWLLNELAIEFFGVEV